MYQFAHKIHNFPIENYDFTVNMEANKSLYKACKILTPLQNKATKD
jgi:hypothetical protein